MKKVLLFVERLFLQLLSFFSSRSDQKEIYDFKDRKSHWTGEAFNAALNSLVLTPIKKSFRTEIQNVSHQATKVPHAIVTRSTKIKEKIKRKIDEFFENRELQEEIEFSNLNKERDTELSQIDAGINKNNLALNRAQEEARDIATMKKLCRNRKEEKGILDKKLTIPFLLFLMFAFDVSFAWESIELWLDASPLTSMLVTLTISFFLGLSAHQIGSAVAKKKVKLAWAWIAACFVQSIVVVYIRINHSDEVILNGIFFISLIAINTLASFGHHAYKPWFSTLMMEKENQVVIDGLKTGTLELERQKDNILEENKLEARNRVIAKISNLKSELAQCQEDIEEARIKKNSILSQFADFEEETIASMDTAFKEGLTHPARKVNGISSKVASIIILLILSISTCFGQTYDVGLLDDQSGSLRADVEVPITSIESYVWDKLGISEEGRSSEGCNIYVSVIGEKSYPPVLEVHLKEEMHWLLINKKDRVESVNSFKAKFIDNLQTVFEQEPKQQHTHIFRPLMNMISKFSRENERAVYIFSDLLSSNMLMSMTTDRYLNDPTLIIGEDYPILKEKLENDMQIPSTLRGTKIVCVFNVDASKDQLTVTAFKFWKRFLESYGAIVTNEATL